MAGNRIRAVKKLKKEILFNEGNGFEGYCQNKFRRLLRSNKEKP